MADVSLRCPARACTGWVCEVADDDQTFWGCGECGNVWPTRDELNAAIDSAIEKRPYRAKCYVRSGKLWEPEPLANEPEDYEELVEEEWEEEDEDDEAEDEDEDRTYPYGVDENSYRCPVSQCDGWVSWDQKTSTWECGWCAATWRDKANLLREIDQIVATHPYRRACYVMVEGEWRPAGIENEPGDYESLVEKEPADEQEDVERG